MDKFITITRADLEPGLLVAQTTHAAAAFAVAYTKDFIDWAKNGRNIVCLAVPNQAALHDLLRLAISLDIPAAGFEEPDLEGELTAIALGEGGGRITSSLPLALKKKTALAGPSGGGVQPTDGPQGIFGFLGRYLRRAFGPL